MVVTVTESPVMLTPAQVEQYRELGYLVVPDVLGRELLAEVKRRVDAIVAHQPRNEAEAHIWSRFAWIIRFYACLMTACLLECRRPIPSTNSGQSACNIGSDSLLMKSRSRVVLISRGESAPCTNRCGRSHWYPAVLLS